MNRSRGGQVSWGALMSSSWFPAIRRQKPAPLSLDQADFRRDDVVIDYCYRSGLLHDACVEIFDGSEGVVGWDREGVILARANGKEFEFAVRVATGIADDRQMTQCD